MVSNYRSFTTAAARFMPVLLLCILPATVFATAENETAALLSCGECKGQITSLDLKYHGTEGAYVVISDKRRADKDKDIVWEGWLNPGETTGRFAGNKGQGHMGANLYIHVGSDRNSLSEHSSIHTSCSRPIGPGRRAGLFEVVSGSSTHGGELCPVDGGTTTPPPSGPPPTDPPPGECGPCEGQVTWLTLRNDGPSARIRVESRRGAHSGVFFDAHVEAGEAFEFSGGGRHGTLGPEIDIYVNGSHHTSIHTSCSQFIGPGLTRGNFVVLDGESRNGGRLCPVDEPSPPPPPPPPSPECPPCESGATQLTLRYTGSDPANIIVTQQRGNRRPELFSGVVQPDGAFTFSGELPHGLMVPRIFVWIDGTEHVTIHTSCDDPPEPGRRFGLVTVVSGFHNAGPFCPIPEEPCPPTLEGPQLELDVRLVESEIIETSKDVAYQRSVWTGRVTSDADLTSFEITDKLNAEITQLNPAPPFGPGVREVTFEVRQQDPRELVDWRIQADDGCGNVLIRCPAPNLSPPQIRFFVRQATLEHPYPHVLARVTAQAGIVVLGYYNTHNVEILGEPVFTPGDTHVEFIARRITLDQEPRAYLGVIVNDACGNYAEDDPPFRWDGEDITDGIVFENPTAFELHQNYPNPFNPQTQIQFQLPEDGHVTLRIFDVMGREIRTLVDGELGAGYHNVMWDGTNARGQEVAGGIYLYRIEAGTFTATRSMTFIK